jgi:hypothetical protein
MSTLELRLEEIVRSEPGLMQILREVRELELPEWGVGAGVIRNAVWGRLHGRALDTRVNDVDVAYFDSTDLGREREHAAEQQLKKRMPEIQWDVTNEAAVHLWYEKKFGYPIEPLQSVEDAVATWPETATAVAVRLLPDDGLKVIAPLGLDDLFAMIWRRNPRQITVEIFRKRLEEKRVSEAWPKVTVISE